MDKNIKTLKSKKNSISYGCKYKCTGNYSIVIGKNSNVTTAFKTYVFGFPKSDLYFKNFKNDFFKKNSMLNNKHYRNYVINFCLENKNLTLKEIIKHFSELDYKITYDFDNVYTKEIENIYFYNKK